MTEKDKQSKERLKSEYLKLVKAGLDIQKKGDITAYKLNALRAEQVAQKLSAVSKTMSR